MSKGGDSPAANDYRIQWAWLAKILCVLEQNKVQVRIHSTTVKVKLLYRVFYPWFHRASLSTIQSIYVLIVARAPFPPMVLGYKRTSTKVNTTRELSQQCMQGLATIRMQIVRGTSAVNIMIIDDGNDRWRW